jgi:hypothetical protein
MGDPLRRCAAAHESAGRLGSGFQHEKYFAALSDLFFDASTGDDYATHPKYIVDMGCGDETLLRRLL